MYQMRLQVRCNVLCGVVMGSALLLAAAETRAGSGIRLSPDLPEGSSIRSNFVISPDGARVAFHTVDASQNRTVYSNTLDGASIAELSEAIPDIKDVLLFTNSGGRIVFNTSFFDSGNKGDIYSVPSSGGLPVRINGDYPLRTDQSSPLISANGSHVVFMSPPDADNLRLYSAPILGGQAPKPVSVPVGPGTEIDHTSPILYSASADRVIFNNREDDSYSLIGTYSRASDGSGLQVKVHPDTIISENFNPMQLTPDGGRVIFEGREYGAGGHHLYTSPVSGGLDPTKLTSDSFTGFTSVDVTPDNSSVVFIASSDLYSVPALGGEAPTPLGDPLGDSLRFVSEAYISPDSSHAVFIGYTEPDLHYELFSVPVPGGTPIPLNDLLAPMAGIQLGSPMISPDGKRVIYRADRDVDGEFELFSVSILGGPVVKLGAPLSEAGSGPISDKVLITPDGQSIVYKQDVNGERLWMVPILGGDPSPLTDVGVFDNFDLTPDGSHLLYIGKEHAAQDFGLFALTIPEPAAIQFFAFLAVGHTIRRRRSYNGLH